MVTRLGITLVIASFAALGSLLLAQWGWISVAALATATSAGALMVRLWPAGEARLAPSAECRV